jgi:hypothetical protein
MWKVLKFAILVFIILFSAYLFVELVPSQYLGGIDRVRIVSGTISAIGKEAWQFSRPFIQLIIILTILQTLLEKSKLKFDIKSLDLVWDIRSLIASLVVVSFCIAVLAGISGSSSLKDVALVVVGFYLGGLIPKARKSEIEGDY